MFESVTQIFRIGLEDKADHFMTDMIVDWTRCNTFILLHRTGLSRLTLDGDVEHLTKWEIMFR